MVISRYRCLVGKVTTFTVIYSWFSFLSLLSCIPDHRLGHLPSEIHGRNPTDRR